MMFNHLEYNTMSLDMEYRRDGHIPVPTGYYSENDPQRRLNSVRRADWLRPVEAEDTTRTRK